jgi:hypothetical protein
MERRHFLKVAFGFAAGAAALATSVEAAPLAPHPLEGSGRLPPAEAHPAVTTAEEVDRLKPEQVRWGHHWHRRWHRWHRRHWGWHRHRWHRHHWHRHWRRW